MPVTSTPPQETGKRLALFDRSKRDGPNEQLRVCLDTYEGHDFVRIQLWRQDRERQWWPVKGAGATMRVRELDQWRSAIEEAMKLTGQGQATPRRERGRAPANPSGRPLPGLDQARDFDEFSADQPR